MSETIGKLESDIRHQSEFEGSAGLHQLNAWADRLAALQAPIVTDGFIDIVMLNYHGHEMAGNREDMKAALTAAHAAPEVKDDLQIL